MPRATTKMHFTFLSVAQFKNNRPQLRDRLSSSSNLPLVQALVEASHLHSRRQSSLANGLPHGRPAAVVRARRKRNQQRPQTSLQLPGFRLHALTAHDMKQIPETIHLCERSQAPHRSRIRESPLCCAVALPKINMSRGQRFLYLHTKCAIQISIGNRCSLCNVTNTVHRASDKPSNSESPMVTATAVAQARKVAV